MQQKESDRSCLLCARAAEIRGDAFAPAVKRPACWLMTGAAHHVNVAASISQRLEEAHARKREGGDGRRHFRRSNCSVQ
jgi:hypothetical protein